MAAAGGQHHNLGSFPITTSQELVKEGKHMLALYCRGPRECNIPVQKNGHKGVEKKPLE